MKVSNWYQPCTNQLVVGVDDLVVFTSKYKMLWLVPSWNQTLIPVSLLINCVVVIVVVATVVATAVVTTSVLFINGVSASTKK